MIVDLHCDTLNKMYINNIEFNNDMLHVNKEKLNKANYILQVFAIFYNDINYDIKHVENMVKTYNNIGMNVNNYKELLNNYPEVSSILALEDGGYIKSIYDLEYIYSLGIKIICLTWNYPNSLGYPHTINKGLTKLGVDVIKKMESLNMIICVSHLSDKGFYDVYNNTTKPFIASHSNCRSICNHSRNLTDDMIIKINERNGLIGINFYNMFVSNEDITYIDDLIKHINHIRSIASVNIISLGSDFDGIDNEVEIKDASYMYLLKDRLLYEGYTHEEVDKICYKNALLFLKNNLK